MSNEQTIIVPQVAPITSEDNAYFIDAVFFPRPPEHIPEKDRMFLPSREELSRLACMAPGHPITTDHSEWINYVHPNGVMSCHCTKPAMRIGQIVSAHIDEQGRMCGSARLDPTTLGFMEAAKIHGGEKPDVSIGVYATRQVVDGKAVVTFSLDHVALVRTGKGFGTHIVSGHSKIRPDLTFTGRKFGMKDDDNKFMQFIAEQRQRRQQQIHSGTSGNQVCAFSQNAKTIAQSTQMNSCAVVLYAIGARVDVVHCQFGLSNTNGSSSMSSSETANTSAPAAPASTPATANTTAPVAAPATTAPTPNEAPRELDGTDAPDTLDHVKQLEELIASSGDQFVQRDAKFLEVVKAQNLKNTTLEERNIILEQQLKDALAQLETANNLYGDHTMKQANEIIGVLRQVVEDPNSRPILEQNGLGPNDIEALSTDFKSMDPQTRERFYKLSRTMAAFSQKEVISTQSAPAPSAANAEAERLRQSNLQLLQSIVNTAPKTPATGGSLALKTPFASILTGQAPLSLNRGNSSSSSSSSCAGASMPQPAQSPMQSQSVAAYGMGGSVRQQTFDPSTQNAANEKMLGRRGAPDNDTANPAKQPAYVDLSQMWSTCVFPSAGPPM